MMFGQKTKSHIIFKRQAMALIRLRVRAGWSEPLLVEHTTLLEISCRDSYIHYTTNNSSNSSNRNNNKNDDDDNNSSSNNNSKVV